MASAVRSYAFHTVTSRYFPAKVKSFTLKRAFGRGNTDQLLIRADENERHFLPVSTTDSWFKY